MAETQTEYQLADLVTTQTTLVLQSQLGQPEQCLHSLLGSQDPPQAAGKRRRDLGNTGPLNGVCEADLRSISRLESRRPFEGCLTMCRRKARVDINSGCKQPF